MHVIDTVMIMEAYNNDNNADVANLAIDSKSIGLFVQWPVNSSMCFVTSSMSAASAENVIVSGTQMMDFSCFFISSNKTGLLSIASNCSFDS